MKEVLQKFVKIFGVSLFLVACGGQGEKAQPRVIVPPGQHQTYKDQDASGQQDSSDLSRRMTIAVLLPLSGSEEKTGKALLNAATMALFDASDPRLILLPIDTHGTQDGAQAAAQHAIDAGAAVVIGPLLGQNVKAAGDVLAAENITLISLSNDSSVAAPGRYIMGFLPENEVTRVVDYAVSEGKTRFAGLFPENRYGMRVRSSFGDAVADGNGVITAMQRYVQNSDAVFEPVQNLADYDARSRAQKREVRFLRDLQDDVTDEIANKIEQFEVIGDVSFEAVLVPEGGALLRTLAPLLPFYEVDIGQVQMMGTGLWYDKSLSREPPLRGAWFAAPDAKLGAQAFLQRYRDIFADQPPRIATLAYDAMGLVIHIAGQQSILMDETENVSSKHWFGADYITQSAGFSGLDGLFRFHKNGLNERGLAVLEITSRGFRVKDPAPTSFPQFGYALRD